MTNVQIVEQIANNPEYREICGKVCGGHELADELYQETMLTLLEYDNKKLSGIYERDQMRWFVVGLMMRQFQSNTSPFYRKFRQHSALGSTGEFELIPDPGSDYDHTIDELIDAVEDILEKENWYDRELFKLYIQEGSYRKLSALTMIPYKSIGNSVKALKERIAEQIDNDDRSPH